MESILTSILARNKAFSNETALVQVIYINRTASHINSACSTKGTEILKKIHQDQRKRSISECLLMSPNVVSPI